MSTHDAIDALGIDESRTLALALASQQAPDAAVTVAWQVRYGLADFLHQADIIGPAG